MTSDNNKPSSNQAKYWDKVLDPQNLMEDKKPTIDLETEIRFYLTPAQEEAYQKMGNLQGKKVLEIGCGMGVNAMILSRRGASITAMDISSKRLEEVELMLKQNQILQVQTVLGSGEELPFPENEFDIVYTNAVLIHLDLDKTMKEVYRVLKPGGMAIFLEPMKYHPLVNLYRYTLAPKIWRSIAHYLNYQTIRKMGAYFDSYEHQEYYLFSFLSFYWEFASRNPDKFKKSLSFWHYHIDSPLLKLLPLLRHLCWFTRFCGYKKQDSLIK